MSLSFLQVLSVCFPLSPVFGPSLRAIAYHRALALHPFADCLDLFQVYLQMTAFAFTSR